MALFFPPNPVIGQRFGDYTWDGQKWVCGDLDRHGGSCERPGWFSPIHCGAVAPSNSDIWFDTAASALKVWASVGVTPPQWVTVSPTVLTGAQPTPPVTAGQLWLDAAGWLRVFDGVSWREICQPAPGVPLPVATLPIIVLMTTPPTPMGGQLWLNPSGPTLAWWTTSWVVIGTRPLRTVKTLDPPGAVAAAGPSTVGARAGDFLFVGGMRGIDPVTNQQLDPSLSGPVGSPTYGLNRVQQAFLNMLQIANSEGATQWDCVRIVASITNMTYRPLIDQVMAQPDMWGVGPYPPRRVIGVVQLMGSDGLTEGNTVLPRGDICEIEGTFFRPC